MEEFRRVYPIGIQSFENIRSGNYLYIDKTQYIAQLLQSQSKYVFLSRPRRFGKSLLVSTLKCYFEGKKELFEGLAIADYEKEWTKYPILHFDMSGATYETRESLMSAINYKLLEYEEEYGKGEGEVSAGQRFNGLIRRVYNKVGRQVVVLIDEYDYPMLEVINQPEKTEDFRNLMQDFYAPLKPCGEYLKFVFLTGITKFSQLSIFSKLNNIENISIDDCYAAICGITEEEIHTQLEYDVNVLAQDNGITLDDMYQLLKLNYDGYHFSVSSPDIYNPYSLLTAFKKRRIDYYWFGSGTPIPLIKMLNQFNVDPTSIDGNMVFAEQFNAPTESMTSVIPLLYQSGYLTISGYDPDSGLYTLDIPNQEVRIGLMRCLLANYIAAPIEDSPALAIIALAGVDLRKNNVDGALQRLQTYLSTIPYASNIKTEGHYQHMLYVMFDLMGAHPDIEKNTSSGRIDFTFRSKTTIYIIELKIDDTAQAALNQINDKEFANRYTLDGLPIVKIGISFNTTKRTIEEWVVER